MRVLHVTHEFPPYEFAGTAIYTFNIVKALAERHEVYVFSRLSDKNLPDYKVFDEDRAGYKARFMNRPELGWSPFDASYSDPRAERLFTDYLDEVRPDLVHFQHLLGLSYTCIEEVKKRNIAVVMTLHDFWTMCPMGQRMCYTDNTLCEEIVYEKCGPCVFGKGWSFEEKPEEATTPNGELTFKDWFDHRFRYTPGHFARRPRAALWAASKVVAARIGGSRHLPQPEVLSNNPFAVRTRRMKAALAQCDLLITPSAFLRDEFIRIFDVPPSRIIHSLNGMKFDHVTAHPRTTAPIFRFGFVGSIIPTKGVHVLVNAAKKLLDAGVKGFRVDIFGAPNQWTIDYNAGLIQSGKNHPEIVFHGRFDNKRIGKVLADIDVLVVPSIWYENAPLTLNEAAMTKTPVLASDKGGMLEFVQANGYGRTFKLGDADDLAKHMKALLEDPSRISDLAKNEVYIKPVDVNAGELEAYYERIVARRPIDPSPLATRPAPAGSSAR